MLLEALSTAASEITAELAPGSVDVRLQGRDPEFVVTPAPAATFGEPVPAPDEPVRPAQAVAWCVVLGVAGYAWSRALYRRERRI